MVGAPLIRTLETGQDQTTHGGQWAYRSASSSGPNDRYRPEADMPQTGVAKRPVSL